MSLLKFSQRFYTTKANIIPKICIVGAGPAGFYAAQHLVKNVPNVQIDLIERLPVPFGLVRFGVAPDHPEVKNVINTFTKTAQNPNIRFIGNVNLGTDVSLQQLQDAYNIVLMTYGADEDRTLNIPGENLSNIISARSIVGWYNGLPSDVNLKLDLSKSTAVIIGQGNVAIDVARILLTPIDILKKTDITQYALETLMTSKINKVYLVGRRGPLQAAFTIKELREMLKLPNCYTKWDQNDFKNISEIVQNLPRPRKRITELMIKSLDAPNKGAKNTFIPKFLRSPLEFIGEDKVAKIVLGVNKLSSDDVTASALLTEEKEEIDCDLVIRSIGYKSIQADVDLPFDKEKGIVKNTYGKVTDNLFTAGWLSTGPTGVILTTMSNSFETANLICNTLKEKTFDAKPGYDAIKEILKDANVPIVSWKGWEEIDKYEQEMGKELGKPREKLVDVKKMLEIGGNL